MDPFRELTNQQIKKIFELLDAHIYTYQQNQEMLETIKNDNIIGIITAGHAQIIHSDYNGNENIVEDLYEKAVFGTNITLTNATNYQIIAKEFTEVSVIDYDNLINTNHLKYKYFNIFLRNLFDIINNKFKEKNERLQVLEKKQIRNKLLEYFEIQYKKSLSRVIKLPFSFKELADYLAVNRTAMFRELKNLKEENLIEIKNRKISLLYKYREQDLYILIIYGNCLR